MGRVTYEAVLRDLDAALAFCDSLGLGEAARRSRFGQYRRRLIELIDWARDYRNGGMTEVRKTNLATNQLQYLVALTESVDFGAIFSDMENVNGAGLRAKLKEILEGPYLPDDESPISNRSRNILFELSLAGKLYRAGCSPTLGEHPDIVCEINDRIVGFECKRPFSLSKVAQRIGEAESQLQRDIKDLGPLPLNARGIVAISLSRLMNPRNRLFVASTEARARELLAREVLTMVGDFEDVWNRLREPVIGILFHVVTPALDRHVNRYAIVQQLVLASVALRGSTDDGVCIKLAEALSTIAD